MDFYESEYVRLLGQYRQLEQQFNRSQEQYERLDKLYLDIETGYFDRGKYIGELEGLLRSGIQLVEGLRVFGRDNIHKYDVPAWLGVVKGRLGSTPTSGADHEK